MTPEQRKYLFVDSAIGSAVVNAVLNGAIGWAITLGLAEFPVWKAPGAAFDFVATAFGVAFGTALGAVIQIRIDVARGKITAPEGPVPLGSFIERTPRGVLARAVVIGVVGAVVFGPLGVGLLAATGQEALLRSTFIAAKAGFSAVEGAMMTPFILLSTLAHLERGRRPA